MFSNITMVLLQYYKKDCVQTSRDNKIFLFSCSWALFWQNALTNVKRISCYSSSIQKES